MSELRLSRTILPPLLVTAYCLLAAAYAGAAQWYFRVSYEDLPGVSELEAGDFTGGIRILEQLAAEVDSPNLGMVLATLCGAYVMAGQFDAAVPVCDRAVATGPADIAYNNRGVLHMHRGNIAGARADFDRARPEFVDEYIKRLRMSDPKLIADSNYATLKRYSAGVQPAKAGTNARALRGAMIETLLD